MSVSELKIELKRQYKLLSVDTKRFAVKAFILAILFNIVYIFYLSPTRLFDRPLTNFTAEITHYLLNHLYKTGFSLKGIHRGELILFNKKGLLLIGDACNAFKLYVLYIGFLLSVPGEIAKKLIYFAIGIVLILVLNLVRLFALIWLLFNKPEWTNVAHHYIFTTIVYACMFMLWVKFLKDRKLI